MLWVSVEERLPQPMARVIVHRSDGTIETRSYNPRVDKHYPWRGWPEAERDVTHWMPLPVKPTEDSVDEHVMRIAKFTLQKIIDGIGNPDDLRGWAQQGINEIAEVERGGLTYKVDRRSKGGKDRTIYECECSFVGIPKYTATAQGLSAPWCPKCQLNNKLRITDRRRPSA